MKIRRKITSRAIFVFYALIMLEGILMATPFGLFLYSFYLPFLEGVRQSVLTAWMAAFFFSKIDKPAKQFVPLNEIMDMSAKMTPVLVVDLDLATGEVFNMRLSSTTHFGDVPQPIF
jgi:hypothetical protein